MRYLDDLKLKWDNRRHLLQFQLISFQEFVCKSIYLEFHNILTL